MNRAALAPSCDVRQLCGDRREMLNRPRQADVMLRAADLALTSYLQPGVGLT
jgi:hypothetical protein